MKKNQGLTLMELTVVLALIAIVAAILIPTFLLTTDRARLRGDIQSSRVLQNAIELYTIERGGPPHSATATVQQKITRLDVAGYIRSPRAVGLQSTGATWHVHADHGVIVNITASPDAVHRAFQSLPEDERRYVHGGDLTR